MDLAPYLEALRADLEAAAAAGGDEARQTARLLAGAIDAAARLCLIDALSAMAAEVTAASDLTEVEVRMNGRDPEIVVRVPDAATEPPPVGGGEGSDDEGGTARVSLRLPEHLKVAAEARAGAEGLSVNAWLVRAVAAAVQPSPRDRFPRGGPGRRLTGYARS